MREISHISSFPLCRQNEKTRGFPLVFIRILVATQSRYTHARRHVLTSIREKRLHHTITTSPLWFRLCHLHRHIPLRLLRLASCAPSFLPQSQYRGVRQVFKSFGSISDWYGVLFFLPLRCS